MKNLSALFILTVCVGAGVCTYSFSAESKTKTFDCTDHDVQRMHKRLCRRVFDPIKFKKGEISKINCIAELEDGYDVGICSAVNPTEQRAMDRKKK